MWVSAQVCMEMVTSPVGKKYISKERGAFQYRALLGYHQHNARKNMHGVVLVSFLMATRKYLQKQLKEGKVYLGSQVGGVVHHGREDTTAGM